MPEEATDQTALRTEEERAVLLDAWFSQATEWSKAIFTISSAAIGLIVTGIFTASAAPRGVTWFCLVVAALSFGGATLTCLSAFQRGSEAILGHLTDDLPKADDADEKLRRLKNLQSGFFFWGLVLLLTAAFTHSEGSSVPEKKPLPSASPLSPSVPTFDNVSGIGLIVRSGVAPQPVPPPPAPQQVAQEKK